MGDSNMQESPLMNQFSTEDINTEEIFVYEGIITQELTRNDSSLKWSNNLSNDNPVLDLDSFEDVSETDTFLPMEMVDDMGDPLEILPAKMNNPLQVDYSISSRIKQEQSALILLDNTSVKEPTINTDSAINKNFSCIQCNYKSCSKYNLNKHINGVHNQEFKCRQCDMKYMSKNRLNRHVNVVHKGIKSFNCSQCGNKFSYKHTLLEHVNYIHMGLKPFKCNQCDLKFRRKLELAKHVSKVHNFI